MDNMWASTIDIPQVCLNFSSVVASVNQIKAQTSALRVSLYSSGVHWTIAQYQRHYGFPIYVLCILSAFVALIATLINCVWPPEDDMDSPPGSNYKVRKIRMRVPQKHQRWSGYVYTHLESPRPGGDNVALVESSSGQSGMKNRRDDETMFDRGTMQFLQKTITACEAQPQQPDYT
ncbi:hypothetical protein RvY_00207 [Ramazzottius varieornatus]|uniref:Uncharacterized protein n=1 Tax=Ramazzottius varieornatus TaxID=947166 RepID=A0A1D1UJB9_RAMVA|nr:hypothetical protein RvY_00207 [Ramazzottius varieornatus]